jgi:hypothetical protein
MSNSKVDVLLKTDTFESDGIGEVRLKCYDWTNRVELEAGEGHAWWQHASARHTGTNRLSARLVEFPDSKTKTFQTLLRRSDRTADIEYRDRTIQAYGSKFPFIDANIESTHLGRFRKLAFTNDPAVIAGRLYSGFSFAVPKGEARDLVWCLKEPRMSSEYYILPAEGRMQGFTHFFPGKSQVDNPVVGPRGTDMVFQNLPASNLVPGKRYIIWFSMRYGNVESAVFSLNFPPPDQNTIGDVFNDFFRTPRQAREKP